MKYFAYQELASAIVFFTFCGWLIVDAVLSIPHKAPLFGR